MRLDTKAEVVAFMSSSGHCTFDCQYCIINPIAKKKPSLDYEDIRFFLERLGNRKAFLAFSGVGDFFAGYSKSQRLLDRILDHDVEVALDTNGAITQEFPELDASKLAKIRYINLTMHYRQIKEKGLLKLWARNAEMFHRRAERVIMQDYILSPDLADEWDEAIHYYAHEVFPQTGKTILLIRDVNRPMNSSQEAAIAALSQTYSEVIGGAHQENFAAPFVGKETVQCPAGQSYFRVWNDGRVQGCPNLPGVKAFQDNGNLKERRLHISPTPFSCNSPQYCDCQVIEGLGKMG